MLVVSVILSVIALGLTAAGSRRPKEDEKHSSVEVLLVEGVVETAKKLANGRKPDSGTPCLPASLRLGRLAPRLENTRSTLRAFIAGKKSSAQASYASAVPGATFDIFPCLWNQLPLDDFLAHPGYETVSDGRRIAAGAKRIRPLAIGQLSEDLKTAAASALKTTAPGEGLTPSDRNSIRGPSSTTASIVLRLSA